ncbi:hypothetical protein M501DRAFT_1017512 [Patellaria atrata CBS 101060]|uniref:Uncharacterized protein n=1 Tax=Patellaria atrata CBS 101060 TaxID=1346257 RepID=A0A9P4S7V4_9PEZI|nr:hypothetical protein M501DRAFT_1017512 [Patellaria atrata CBS 101060]
MSLPPPMFSNGQHNLVHLPRNPRASVDPDLPQGACQYILTQANGARERCCCQSYMLNKEKPGSMCGCGHQAWVHERRAAQSGVSAEQFQEVLTEVKKLKRQLDDERRLREALSQGVYSNMTNLKLQLDDKAEEAVDKVTECFNDIRTIREHLSKVDEVVMDLENRMERVDPGRSTRSLTPVLESVEHQVITQLPIRIERPKSQSWTIRTIFVPSKQQPFAFDFSSTAYKRCESRGLHKELTIANTDHTSFTKAVHETFANVLKGRMWIPLKAYRLTKGEFLSRIVLQEFATDESDQMWDKSYLEEHCICHDKLQGDVLYISLVFQDITWEEIHSLPAMYGVDQTCWSHDSELDGEPQNVKSMGDQLMYESSDPPPYTSRTHSDLIRSPTALDVLASASLLPSHRSSAIQSPITPNDRAAMSLRSFELDGSDDEHRDKKLKLRPKGSEPALRERATSGAPRYVSGRSKRKLPQKPKEPVSWTVSEWKYPPIPKKVNNLLHRHTNDKDTQQGPSA